LPSRPTGHAAPATLRAQIAPLAEECPICAGAGFLRYDVTPDHPLFSQIKPCSCREADMARRRSDKLLALSGLHPTTRQRMTFANFDPSTDRQRHALEATQAYAEHPEGWLYLYGGYGTGKTHLLNALAWTLIERGIGVLYVVVPDLLVKLRQTFDGSADESFSERMTRIQEADVLILDDLGSERRTGWVDEQLFTFINHRYVAGSPLVVASNHKPGNGEGDIGGRIGSRLSDWQLVTFIGIDANDYRKETA
jgi:DNA replication protein DnaC